MDLFLLIEIDLIPALEISSIFVDLIPTCSNVLYFVEHIPIVDQYIIGLIIPVCSYETYSVSIELSPPIINIPILIILNININLEYAYIYGTYNLLFL